MAWCSRGKDFQLWMWNAIVHPTTFFVLQIYEKILLETRQEALLALNMVNRELSSIIFCILHLLQTNIMCIPKFLVTKRIHIYSSYRTKTVRRSSLFAMPLLRFVSYILQNYLCLIKVDFKKIDERITNSTRLLEKLKGFQGEVHSFTSEWQETYLKTSVHVESIHIMALQGELQDLSAR